MDLIAMLIIAVTEAWVVIRRMLRTPVYCLLAGPQRED